MFRWFRNAISFLLSLIVTACGDSGAVVAVIAAAVILAGLAAPVTVPLVVFPGGGAVKPALLLPFTSEVQAAAVTPNGNKLYAADILHNTVSVIDLKTRRVSAVLDVETGPQFVAITPDGKKVLVSNFGTRDLAGHALTIIDSVSDSVVAILNVGAKPFAIAITPNSKKAYVTNASGNSVSVIDLDTNSVSATIGVAAGFASLEPVAVVMNSNGSQAYVVNRGSNDVAIIDTNTDQVLHTIPVGVKPTGVALLPDDSKLYVSNRDSDTVSILDTSTNGVTNTLAVSEGPMAVVTSVDGKRLYVAHAFSGSEDDLCGTDGGVPVRHSVSVIDVATNSVLPGTITVGDAPIGIVITGDDAKLYSVSACSSANGAGSVSRLNTVLIGGNANVVADTIVTAARGTGLVLAPDSKELYVLHPHAVSVLDVASDTISASPINVRGAGPIKLALTADGAKLYAIRPGSDSVAVIDVGSNNISGTYLGSLPVGSRPSDIAITTRPANNQIVVTNAGFSRTPDTRVSLIDVTGPGVVDSQIDTVALTDQSINPNTTGRGPIAVAINRDNTRAFIGNFGDFFSNSRVPGRYLSQLNLQTLQVKNFDNYGEWLTEVTVDPQATLNAGASIVDPNLTIDGVVYAADFLNDNVSRGQDSNPTVNFNIFNNIDRPASIAIADHRAIVANYRTINLAGTDVSTIVEVELDGATHGFQLPGVNPGTVAVTPDHSAAYLLHGGDRSFLCGPADNQFCQTGTTVSVIKLPFGNVVAPPHLSLSVGHRPTGIAFTPDAGGVPKRAYISNYFDGTVTVIQPWTMGAINPAVVSTLNVGKGPSGIVVNTQGTRAYVANSISNTISVISIDNSSFGTVVGTIDLNP